MIPAEKQVEFLRCLEEKAKETCGDWFPKSSGGRAAQHVRVYLPLNTDVHLQWPKHVKKVYMKVFIGVACLEVLLKPLDFDRHGKQNSSEATDRVLFQFFIFRVKQFYSSNPAFP